MIVNIVGCDGSGKSKQIEILKPWIEGNFDCPVRVLAKGDVMDFDKYPECRFFGCSYNKFAIDYLPHMKGESRALIMFYMMATIIRHYPPGENEVVLFDGYWHKNYATEAALGISTEWLRQVTSFFPVPDYTFLLDIPPDQIVGRQLTFHPYECGQVTECSIESFINYQNKVLYYLRELGAAENWISIDATRPDEAVASDIKSILEKPLAKMVQAMKSGVAGY
jgi:thymidylate kinase